MEKLAETDGMVLVMGVTGSGKSTFINTLKPNSMIVSHGLESTPSPPQAVQMYLDEHQKCSVIIVDTPGFDDTWRTDTEILEEITEYLATQYTLKIPLKGIIYLHQIHENKMKGSARKYLEIFQSLCGDHALGNVTLVTTRWDQIGPEKLGEALEREQELIDKWWRPMQKKGSHVTQWRGSKAQAEAIVLEMVRDRDNIVLDIQRELVDGNKEVGETKAGVRFGQQLDEDVINYKKKLSQLDSQISKSQASSAKNEGDIKKLKEQKQEAERVVKKLEKSRKRLKVRVGQEVKEKVDSQRSLMNRDVLATGIAVFASVLSITLTVVKFVAFG